jgi:predicted Zn finger-like uncharacterized protein
VVVVCESCSTRFRIDDARIPAKGRLVRCSQCKATFIAKPEDASFEETVEEVVAEVTDSGAAPVPEPAVDLFEAGGGDLGGGTAARSQDEERWEFDEEPRKSDPPAFAPESRETEPPSSTLDEIGDPMEWDLLRGSVEREAKQAAFVEEPPAPPPPLRAERVERAEARSDPEPFLRPIAVEPSAPARSVRRASSGAVGRLARGVLGLGAWVALAGVAFVAAKPLLPREAAHAASRTEPRTIGLADGEARGVRGRFVENAFAPALFVVEGELARPNADPRLGLRVRFVSAAGDALGEPVWAGAALPVRHLREREPATLRSELDASAAAAARGGRFVAVFESAPAEAASFGLSLEPLPEALAPQSPEAAPAVEGAAVPDGAQTAAPEGAALPAAGGAPAPDATASSPPSSPPSSE